MGEWFGADLITCINSKSEIKKWCLKIRLCYFRSFLVNLSMIQVGGIYDNGNIILDQAMAIDKPVKVIVTFIDEDVDESVRLTLSDFSFLRSRLLLKDVNGSISDAVIEERRSEL